MTLTSYHPSDECPVPPKATNHVDYNGPPAKNRKLISKDTQLKENWLSHGH